jgi:ATP-dependent Clp protease ATP-binding subunit ClpA
VKNKHAGSSFDDFLAEEGLDAEVAARAAKRIFVEELEQKMARKKAKKSTMRKALKSPTTAARLFSDHTGISLETMAKAASVVGCELEIRLVPKPKTRAA